MTEYRCKTCKHFRVALSTFTAMGDVNISERWTCVKRDDERCVKACGEYERRDA